MIQKRFDENINLLLPEISEATSTGVALAVSGGSDSIALLNLVSHWAQSLKVRLVVFSVNHNLRPEALQEIDFVRREVAQFGYEFYELFWDNDGSKIAVQERAREARYAMMSTKCHGLGINILLTAHHLDDMLETYLMRKNRKSGIFGLSCSNSFFYDNIQIIRPLFSFFKSELIAYLNNLNIKWLEDPSNLLSIYERNKVRGEIACLPSEKKFELITEMKFINEKANSLNKLLISIIAEAVSINNFGVAFIDLKKIRNQAIDIQIQVINYVVTIISGKKHLPRFRSMQQIIDKINALQKINSSLHGCLLKQLKDKLLVLREKAEIFNIIVI